MRRAAPKVPISPAMLRHFAAITVVATVCLGMFANGENKQAAAAENKVEAPAGEQGGGMMNAMFGAEEAALKKSREGGRKEVNGLTLGKGTRLENNSVDPDDTGDSGGGGGGGGVGHIDNFYGVTPGNAGPGAIGAMPDPAAGPAKRRGVPAPIKRDANGIPIPAFAAPRANGAGAPDAAPPRAPTQADFSRMLEMSRARGESRYDPSEGME